MRQIAIYGKGGVGKSTVVSNVTASLASMGYNVMQIGCDPKADSTRTLLNGRNQTTVLDAFREISDRGESKIHIDSIIERGYNDVICVEAGGPEPGVGCAGRGIIKAISLLREGGIFNQKIDFVFYDVLGDVVCGGFAMPIRRGYAQEIYLVASGELMSLYAANNISKGIKRFSSVGGSKLGGVICNSKNIKNELDIVKNFADKIGSDLISFIPFSNTVQQAERQNKTVIEYDKNSKQSSVYLELAKRIVSNKKLIIPKPLNDDELNGLFKR